MEKNNLSLDRYNKLVLGSYFQQLKIPFFTVEFFSYAFLQSIFTVGWAYMIEGSQSVEYYTYLFLLLFLIASPIYFIFLKKPIHLYKEYFGKSSAYPILLSSIFPELLGMIVGRIYILVKVTNDLKSNNLMISISENNNASSGLKLDVYSYDNSINLEDYINNNKYIFSEKELIKNIEKINEKIVWIAFGLLSAFLMILFSFIYFNSSNTVFIYIIAFFTLLLVYSLISLFKK